MAHLVYNLYQKCGLWNFTEILKILPFFSFVKDAQETNTVILYCNSRMQFVLDSYFS